MEPGSENVILQFVKQLDEVRKGYEDTNSRLESSRRTRDQHVKTNQELSQSIVACRASIANLRPRLVSTQTSLSSLRTQVSISKKNLDECNARYETISPEIEKKRESYDALCDEFVARSLEFHSMVSSGQHISDAKAELATKLASLESRSRTLMESRSRVGSKLDRLRRDLNLKQKSVESLDQRTMVQEKELDESRRASADLGERCREEIISQKKRLDKAELDGTRLSNRVSELRERAVNVREERDSLRRVLSKQKGLLVKLRAQESNLRRQISLLRESRNANRPTSTVTATPTHLRFSESRISRSGPGRPGQGQGGGYGRGRGRSPGFVPASRYGPGSSGAARRSVGRGQSQRLPPPPPPPRFHFAPTSERSRARRSVPPRRAMSNISSSLVGRKRPRPRANPISVVVDEEDEMDDSILTENLLDAEPPFKRRKSEL